MTETATTDIAQRGYDVLRGAVPAAAVDRALRHIHLDVVQRGIPPEWLNEWVWSAHWFPHLKWDAEIVSLLDHLPGWLRDGELCDPQIVVQPPDAGEHALEPHVDEVPEWAAGRSYERILGIALTRADRRNGGLVVWPLDGGEPEAPALEPGDVIVMHPDAPHTSGLNRVGTMRYAVYFRFLEPR